VVGDWQNVLLLSTCLAHYHPDQWNLNRPSWHGCNTCRKHSCQRTSRKCTCYRIALLASKAIRSLWLLWNDLLHTALISKHDEPTAQAANVKTVPPCKPRVLSERNQEDSSFFFLFYHLFFWISLNWTLPSRVKNLIVSVYNSKQQRLFVTVCTFGMSDKASFAYTMLSRSLQ